MTSIFKFNVKSTHEPSTTGTLNAKPSSFPSKLGSTLPTADAAPVDVGIILFTAALPLLLVMPFYVNHLGCFDRLLKHELLT